MPINCIGMRIALQMVYLHNFLLLIYQTQGNANDLKRIVSRDTIPLMVQHNTCIMKQPECRNGGSTRVA
jgi:hypothetical protein